MYTRVRDFLMLPRDVWNNLMMIGDGMIISKCNESMFKLRLLFNDISSYIVTLCFKHYIFSAYPVYEEDIDMMKPGMLSISKL